MLVVLTTMSGYSMAPLTCSTSALSLLYTTAGTALCVASANSFNQWAEVPYDAQMQRTRQRVLVQHRMSPLHAFGFGCVSGLTGVTLLASCVNPLTAVLGAMNIVLYAGIYTPLKRRHVINTWVGSIVGAIPPMIGWTAVTGTLDPGCWLMGGVLFAWQFPHFNALSFLARHDYAQAGYSMLAAFDPKHNALVSLRYALALFPLCAGISYLGVCSPCFLLTSSAVNGGLAYWAYRFHQDYTNESTARRLFHASLWHLPALIALMLLHKVTWPHAEERKEELGRLVHEPFGVHSK